MGMLQQGITFLKEVRIETKKVTFPKRKETFATTAAVIVVVILIGFYLGVTDFILSKTVGLVLS